MSASGPSGPLVFQLLSFANLDIENLISQTITARRFKLGQLKEDNE